MVKITQNILRQLKALNEWLSEVFGEGVLLSSLLSEAGLTEDEIVLIKNQHLAGFLEAIVNKIAATTDKHDGERRNDMMIRHYGLRSGKHETLQSIGDDFQLSRERIRQLVQKRLQLYRNAKRKAQFKTDLATLARDLLK